MMILMTLTCFIAPVQQGFEVKPAVNLNKIGTSSEWSGNLLPTTTQTETNTPTRSKVSIKFPPMTN